MRIRSLVLSSLKRNCFFLNLQYLSSPLRQLIGDASETHPICQPDIQRDIPLCIAYMNASWSNHELPHWVLQWRCLSEGQILDQNLRFYAPYSPLTYIKESFEFFLCSIFKDFDVIRGLWESGKLIMFMQFSVTFFLWNNIFQCTSQDFRNFLFFFFEDLSNLSTICQDEYLSRDIGTKARGRCQDISTNNFLE